MSTLTEAEEAYLAEVSSFQRENAKKELLAKKEPTKETKSTEE